MTAREFFEQRVVEGRAVLRGEEDEPQLWLAQVNKVLVLCNDYYEEFIESVRDDMDAELMYGIFARWRKQHLQQLRDQRKEDAA